MKVKTCPHCEEILFCKACDERVTPDQNKKSLTKIYIDPESKKQLEEKAQQAGMSLSAFLGEKIKEEDEAT